MSIGNRSDNRRVMLAAIGCIAIALIFFAAFSNISTAISGGSTTTIVNNTTIQSTTIQSTTIQSTTIQSTTVSSITSVTSLTDITSQFTTSQFTTNQITSVFDTTQITSQFTTTVQTQITSNSCPASQLGHSINATGFLGCQYPTNNAYTYVNNSQVSTTHGVTTPVQVGMKISYTPTTSSVYVSASAGGQTNLISCGISEQLDYGTGPAPGQGAAQTGILIGDAGSFFFTYTGNQYNIPLLGLVTGLTPGTTYWFDIAFSSAPGAGGCGTATWSTATVVFLSV